MIRALAIATQAAHEVEARGLVWWPDELVIGVYVDPHGLVYAVVSMPIAFPVL